MNCGGDDLFCQGMTWLEHNEFIASTMAELVSRLGTKASGFIGAIALFVEHNAQAIFGAGGLAFGIWRWWRYREQILHRRLEEYLEESDARLKHGQQYVLDALQRPGPGQPFKLPLFASEALRSVLRERRWDHSQSAIQVASSADWQLSQAIEKIERQLRTADDNVTSLRQQFATAHILRGAIAASVARRIPSNANQDNNFALTEFRTVLQIPGHEADLTAKEFEAHQLRKLGHLNEALASYQEMERMASAVEDRRRQSILISRAKRYQAEMLQACSTQLSDSGEIVLRGNGNAYALISKTQVRSALDLRKEFAPFQNWDAIEQGDINYVAALISSNLGFNLVEAQHLDDAETAYSSALGEMPQRRFWHRGASRRIHTTAMSGLAMVEKARRGIYDAAWLTPPLKKPK